MNRRDELVAKFRASSLDRIREMRSALAALDQGDGSDLSPLKALARDLHTMKGEARMLGMPAVAEVVHGCEDLLGGKNAASVPAKSMRERVAHVLDTLARHLRGELGPDDAAAEALRASLSGSPAAPAAAAADPQPVPSRSADDPSQRWVRVAASGVERLSEGISEFVSDFRRIELGLREVARRLPREDRTARSMIEDVDRVRARLEALSRLAWTIRLVPVEPLLLDLAEHARSLASSQGKKLRVNVAAGRAAIERTALDELSEPLLHVIRNAVDHGVETPERRGAKGPEASIELAAETAGSDVLVSISDDGAGIDTEAIRRAAVERGLLDERHAKDAKPDELMGLLFVHGFSTRKSAGELSGRGVGLDVVRSKVEAMGGTVALHTAPGKGTRVRLKLPATLAQEPALVIECGGALFGISNRQVLQVVRMDSGVADIVAGSRILRWRETTIPLVSFARTVGSPDEREAWALVVDAGRRCAITVPRLVGEYLLRRRPLEPLIEALPYAAATAVLDDGRPVVMLLLGALLREGDSTPRTAPRATRARRVLVVDDSPIVSDLLAEILSDAGMQVRTAANGRDALAQCDIVMPDLVLSDIDMPVMDGFELLAALRQRSSHLPVIMLSTRASAEDRRRATALGADAYIVKSEFQDGGLLAMLDRFLGGGSGG